MLIIAGLALIVALTLATGFFVAQEFAYVAVDRSKLRADAEAGDAAAARALHVTGRLSFVLSGAQLGITVTALLAGYFAEPYLGEGLASVIGLGDASTVVSIAVALIVATVVQMVVGELAPKNLAIAKPDALARALARPTLTYLMIVGPVVKLFDATSNRLLRLVGIEPVEELPQGATPEDLDRIIERSRAEGVLDDDTSRLLDHGLDFRTRTAGDAMVPRVDVITVQTDEPAVRVVELLRTGHTRFPVVGDAVDDIRGVVAIADVVDVPPESRGSVPVGELCTAPVLVPETLPLPAVLERLRSEHRQLACVIDEYGGFAGIVSLEDVAEELVGEIHDEDDLPQPEARHRPDGSWSLPGRWRLDEVADATGISLPAGPTYDTLSGLILQHLGRIPVAGDEALVDLPPVLTADNESVSPGQARLRVASVRRHVPAEVQLSVVAA